MHTFRFLVLILVIFMFSTSTYAEEKGRLGFSVEVAVEGFFSPKLSKVVVKEVFENSPAAMAGIIAGQEILSIDGCEIPGCPAGKAKKLMKRNSGDILPILVKKMDGNQSLINIHVK
jgi:C-terminal processing protease CtpA/Prc